MRTGILIILLLCWITTAALAQDGQPVSLHIGDPAPPLRLRAWLKGEPVRQFEKGRVYVLEFWATWCVPCKAAMPHLSALAEKYRDKATIIGVDVYEQKTTPAGKIKAFVDSMGTRMDYLVAAEDSNFMTKTWLHATGERAIPQTMVINQEGNLAWIGHPMYLDKVLSQIVENTWDVAKALSRRNTERLLDSLDVEAYYEACKYIFDMKNPEAPGKPDSILWVMDQIVRKEPRLKYAHSVAYQTFASLLKTDPPKAYAYGKQLMISPNYKEQVAYGAISDVIKTYTGQLNIPPEIYQLGAEAIQAIIDRYPYPEILDLHKDYSRMADWYARANNKTKAIQAQEKAIEVLKSRKDFSATDLAALESRLQQYKNQ